MSSLVVAVHKIAFFHIARRQFQITQIETGNVIPIFRSRQITINLKGDLA